MVVVAVVMDEIIGKVSGGFVLEGDGIEGFYIS